MNGFCIADIAAACRGKLVGNADPKTSVGELVIDSRMIREGDVFAALRGERVDGHDYIAKALQSGASCCLAERIPEDVEGAIILVDDVQTAMEQIAGAYRARFSIPLVGITGSVGKTTAKEMIAAVLSQRWCLLKTDGNLNNQLGVPMMLSRLTQEHEAAVIEMGISGFGEMSELAEFVRPTMAVFTKIGHAHLEFLHDLDGVLRAKTEMLEYLPDTAPVIVNGDDEKLRAFSCRQPKILYGLSDGCDVRAEEIRTEWNGMTCVIVSGDRRIPVHIPQYGRHIIYGALAGAAVGLQLGLSDEEIAEGIASFENVGRRAEVTETGCLTVVDDSYNANPDSVSFGIDSLTALPGRHLCILGDMLELGGDSPRMHYDIGKYAVEKGAALVICTGECSRNTAEGAGEKGRWYESRQLLLEALPGFLQRDDSILVKASKAMHFEEIAAFLRKVKMAPPDAPVLLLDLDDTILDFKKAEAVAVTKSLDELGVPHDDNVIRRYSEINQMHWEMLEEGKLTREEVLVQRFAMLFREIDADADAVQMRMIYEKNLAVGHWFVDGAENLLNKLAGKVRLVLISNGTAVVQRGRIKSAGIAPLFERIFISELLEVNKPDPDFFRKCFEDLPNFRKENCLLIGDSLTSDIRGGVQAGVPTCWFNLRGKEPRADIVPDYTITSLSELPPLLRLLFGTEI